MGCIGKPCIVSVTFKLEGVSKGADVTTKPAGCTPSASTTQIEERIQADLQKDVATDSCTSPCECLETRTESTAPYTYTYGPWEIRNGECVSTVKGSCQVTQTTKYGQCVKKHS
jgi:hypothetical protein